jgi:hypothetical protein
MSKIAIYEPLSGDTVKVPVQGNDWPELSEELRNLFPNIKKGDSLEVYEGENMIMWFDDIIAGDAYFEWSEDYRYSDW